MLSLSQNRTTLLDKKNKGGKSLVLRCASAVKNNTECPFYCKLRRSNKDDMWYICAGFQPMHNCEPPMMPSKYHDLRTAMADKAKSTSSLFALSHPFAYPASDDCLEPI